MRAGIGHGEGGGDACRREEEVAGLLAQLAVEVDGEGIVALNERCLIEQYVALLWRTRSLRVAFRYYSDELLPLANTINIFFDYTFAETGNGKNFYPGSQASSTEILGMTDDGGDQGIEVVNQGSGGFEGQHALEFFTTGCAYSGGCTP